MSREIALDAIHLRPTPRLAHTEYCSNTALIREVEKCGQKFDDAWDIDFVWTTNDGPIPLHQRGRVTDMGHADFLEGGTDRRPPIPSPFKNVGEVLSFDAVQEYGLLPFDELVDYYEKHYLRGQEGRPNQLFPGGYYNTVVSGAIQMFGWDLLLEAAACPHEFEVVLDSIFRLSLHNYRAWAQTSIEVFISHDDMVWSEGPFMHPDFYRRVIFPRYAKLWEPLLIAGKKVLFCSDGDWGQFTGDIAEAGAHGFIFEPMMTLEKVVSDFADTHLIASSKVDCRTLTFGSTDEIAAEVDATMKLANRCKGFMFAVGNHIPSNVPVKNAIFYIDYLRMHWRQSS